ncbi:MAG: multiheme c-type cytochrome [Syntrophobacteraceae bacterium]
MKSATLRCGVMLLVLQIIAGMSLTSTGAQDRLNKSYVGSHLCRECHAEEFRSFQSNSKKAGSYESVALMKKGLSESEIKTCYECHTTGYGEPGGFRSELETPDLKNAGCETCHGPGSIHIQTENAGDIKTKPKVADCSRCHNAERVESFKFKPLIYGGAH